MNKCPKCGNERYFKSHTYVDKRGFEKQYVKCSDNNCRKGFCLQHEELGYSDNIPEGFIIEGNNATLVSPTGTTPPDIGKILSIFKVDENVWKVQDYKVNTWQVAMKGTKTTSEGMEPIPKVVNLYKLEAKLVRLKPVVQEWPVIKAAQVNVKPIKTTPPKRDTKIALVIPDIQAGFKKDIESYSNKLEPLHDRFAMDIVWQIAEFLQPETVVLLGDNLDLPSWSTHFMIKPEFIQTTQPTIDELASWYGALRGIVPNANIEYIEGNHEKRLLDNIIKNTMESYALKRANMPDEDPIISVPFLLGLDKMGITYHGDYPRGEYWINDDLVCHHGNKVGAKSGQTVTKVLDEARHSSIFGHIHRVELACKTVRSRRKNHTYLAASFGTLCRLDASIVPTNARQVNWQQGCGVVEYTDDWFNIHPVVITNNKAIYNGRLFESRSLEEIGKIINLK
tara:strand:- start:5507 stop:6862 length:1356 start_codon:yes stop_codon:yes gene_type:complete